MSITLTISGVRPPRESYSKIVTFRARIQYNGRNYFVYIPKKYKDLWDKLRKGKGEVEVIILVE